MGCKCFIDRESGSQGLYQRGNWSINVALSSIIFLILSLCLSLLAFSPYLSPPLSVCGSDPSPVFLDPHPEEPVPSQHWESER